MSNALVVGLVILAALMHASWNALVKRSGDRTLTFAVVVAGGLVYAPLLPFIEPPDRASWPYLAGSSTVHLLYYALLLGGYRHGDLGQVYPIARGSGPLLVAVAGLALAGETLGTLGWVGIALVSGGVLSLASGGRGRAVGYALATGVVIALYTTIDGLGVRAARSALGYVMFGNVLSAIVFPVYVLARRGREVPAFLRAHGALAAAGGVIATLAYSIAIWAMSVTQLAYVASLRETSVIFAAVLGSAFLGEPFGGRRIVASALVALGVVLIGVR